MYWRRTTPPHFPLGLGPSAAARLQSMLTAGNCRQISFASRSQTTRVPIYKRPCVQARGTTAGSAQTKIFPGDAEQRVRSKTQWRELDLDVETTAAQRQEARRARRIGERFRRNIARSSTSPGPPWENRGDTTQNGKIRQCMAAAESLFANFFAWRGMPGRTRLRSQKAMIDSRRLMPHASVCRDFLQRDRGAGLVTYPGGLRPLWASFS
jgi:hypothetical protein